MLRVPVSDLSEGELLLDAEAARYVARVHRKKPGDVCLLFDPARALEAEATVLRIEKEKVVCRVAELRPASVRPSRAIALLQGIGKGDKLDAIVRDATELGATGIVAVESARTIVRLGSKAASRIERWNRIAVEAARQCGRGDAPRVEGPLSFADAVRAHAESDALKLCFWEKATEPAAPHLRDLTPGRALVFVVGPEGGLEEGEVKEAREAGFHVVSLGPFILRTETVAAAVLGAVLLCGGPGVEVRGRGLEEQANEEIEPLA